MSGSLAIPLPDEYETGDIPLDIDVSFAFQPIVSLEAGGPMAHEALLRGIAGESAGSIIRRIQPQNRFQFDQSCRRRALLAMRRLEIVGELHLNCMDASARRLAEMLVRTGDAADQLGIARERLVLEIDCLDAMGSVRALSEAHARCVDSGFRLAADHFGAGDAGLTRLAVLRPAMVKLDRALVRGVHHSRVRQAVVSGILAACRALDIQPVAVGVEHEFEFDWLMDAGVRRFQGYLFARPGFECLPVVNPAIA